MQAEKEQLSKVMERYGIEWEQLGTHREHLSVLDYKKEVRFKEVAELESDISQKQKAVGELYKETVSKQNELDQYQVELDDAKGQLNKIRTKENFMAVNVRRYDEDPDFQLPEPKPLMSAKSYHDKIVKPLVCKLKNAIRSILLQFHEKTEKLKTELNQSKRWVENLTHRLEFYEDETARLSVIEKDHNRLKKGIGKEKAEEIIKEVKAQEVLEKKRSRKSKNEHER